jgi:hypothetical protein
MFLVYILYLSVNVFVYESCFNINNGDYIYYSSIEGIIS